jgi:hypothetical protein
LPATINNIRNAYDKSDWPQLSVYSHQLKGAAGGYGFPDLTRVCGQIESVVSAEVAPQPEKILPILKELESLRDQILM